MAKRKKQPRKKTRSPKKLSPKRKSKPAKKRVAPRVSRKKPPTLEQALKIISEATGYHYNTLRSIFKGNPGEAIRIAQLKDIRGAFKRFQKALAVGRLKRAGVTGTKKQVQEFLELRTLTRKNRVVRKFYKSLGKVPKHYRDFSKQVKKGKNRGLYSVYYDTVFKLPIAYRTAKKLKSENRIVRMSLAIEGADYKDQGRFKKYYTKTEKEKVKANKGEVPYKVAERVARRIADDFEDQEIFEDFIEEFGYVA